MLNINEQNDKMEDVEKNNNLYEEKKQLEFYNPNYNNVNYFGAGRIDNDCE